MYVAPKYSDKGLNINRNARVVSIAIAFLFMYIHKLSRILVVDDKKATIDAQDDTNVFFSGRKKERKSLPYQTKT